MEPGIWRLFQNAAGENPQNSVRAREIRRNNRVRLTLAARRLLLVMAKNSVYASYTLPVRHDNIIYSRVKYCRLQFGYSNFIDHFLLNKCIDKLALNRRLVVF